MSVFQFYKWICHSKQVFKKVFQGPVCETLVKITFCMHDISPSNK